MGTGSYFDKALIHTNGELVETMRNRLQGVKYDTIVGTGLSGTIFTARVAPGLRKKFAIVRKKDDHSTHSDIRIEGQVGSRWVFADDFVQGGGTFKRVLKMMKQHHPDAEFAGIYQYEREDFLTPDEASVRWGNWVTELSIGLLYGPKTMAEVQRDTWWDTAPLKAPVEGWHPRVRKFLTMSSRSKLTVDYQDGYGRPSIYDKDTRVRWTCEDERALPYIVEIEEAAKALGVSVRRMVGEQMDRLPKPRPARVYRNSELSVYDWKNVVVMPAMQAFSTAIQEADEAAIAVTRVADST